MSDTDASEIKRLREWVEKIDAALLATDIVPRTTGQFPNGMDRVECIQYLAAEIERLRSAIRIINDAECYDTMCEFPDHPCDRCAAINKATKEVGDE